MQPTATANRRHTLDPTYFNVIDTEEKAYWLGFLWADGNISKTSTRSSGPNRLRIAQKWVERQHLELFKTAMKTDYAIIPVYHENNNVVAQLDINSRPLCETLQNLGYGSKTERITMPRIQKNLIPHFIRGYFDGDGGLSLYFQQIKKWTVPKQEFSITGQTPLMNEIKTVLTNDAGVTPTVKLKRYKRSPSVSSIRYGKKSDIVKLYRYIYENASIYLDSKHEKFVDFFSRYASDGLQPDALRVPLIQPQSPERA